MYQAVLNSDVFPRGALKHHKILLLSDRINVIQIQQLYGISIIGK